MSQKNEVSNSVLKLQILKIVRFETTFETLTGLLISAGKSISRIGGSDIEPVSLEKEYLCENKTFISRVPYIPGSSIKGRMRSLLELANGLELYSNDKKYWAHTLSLNAFKNLDDNSRIGPSDFIDKLKNSEFDKLFGYNAFNFGDLLSKLSNEKGEVNKVSDLLSNLTPTLLLVDDFYPDANFVCNLYKKKNLVTFDDFLEDKNENRIDRITSAADPRTISRVKPGVLFNGAISLIVYDRSKNNVDKHLKYIVQGLSLLEKTYLGAFGSRGYGRIKFRNISVKIYDPLENKEMKIQPFNNVDELMNNINTIKSHVDKSELPETKSK